MILIRIVLLQRDFLFDCLYNHKTILAHIVEKMITKNDNCARCRKNKNAFVNYVVVFDFFDNFCANCHCDDDNNHYNLRVNKKNQLKTKKTHN